MGRDHPDPRAAGERIAQLLDDVHAAVGARTWASIEELVRLLTDLYGGGLARTIELLGGAEPAALQQLASDDLVASLLLLHGLHPDGLAARVHRAVNAVAPAIRSRGGDVEIEDVDEELGTVRVTLTVPGHGVESVREQIAAMLADAVPDASIAIAVVAAPVSIRLGPKPARAGSGV
ncbi:MAG: hypothetical protein ACHQNA_01450 [Acidimicrobiales bacterium]